MSELSILSALVTAGMSPIGACAMGGNMMAESGMKSNIAQRGMTSMSDAEYTAAADAGTINFAHDAVGYGLCQWTYYTRKQNLRAYAKNLLVSVGDEAMQVQFCVKELKEEYASLWSYLKTTNNIYEAASRICKEYECPAVNNIQTRADFANSLYMQYGSQLEAVAKGETVTDITAQSTIGQVNSSTASTKTPTDIDAEPSSYIMPLVKFGDKTPEAKYVRALLESKGYDVDWMGMDACIIDFQQKSGLTVDGIVGEKTWGKLIN